MILLKKLIDEEVSGILLNRLVDGEDIMYTLSLSCLSNEFIDKAHCDMVLTDGASVSHYLSQKGDIVIRNIGNLSVSYMLEDNIILPAFVHIIRIKDVNIRYNVYMELCRNKFKNYINMTVGNLAAKRITAKDIYNYPISIDNTHKPLVYFKQKELINLYHQLRIAQAKKANYICNYLKENNE